MLEYPYRVHDRLVGEGDCHCLLVRPSLPYLLCPPYIIHETKRERFDIFAGLPCARCIAAVRDRERPDQSPAKPLPSRL